MERGLSQEELAGLLDGAAGGDDLQTVECAPGQGADPNGGEGWGRPMERAIGHGNAAMVAALARAGADLDRIEGMVGTPLSMCAERGKLECAAALLAAGADPNGPESLAGWTPLARAAAEGEHEAMAFLIERGARWEASPSIRRLAKEKALKGGHFACLALIEALELRAASGKDARDPGRGAGVRL